MNIREIKKCKSVQHPEWNNLVVWIKMPR